MVKNYERDYISKHQQIKDKLIDLTRDNKRACFDVIKLANGLGMDIRTVRAHLKVMEIDMVGFFMDAGEKQFCTKEGIALLANMLDIKDKEGD
jgi:hypothetical protein